ncbi:MAG: hypothetical protein V3U03_11140 [Myxococcota bacterium]
MCADAIAERPGDALKALAAAEQAQWRVARSAESEARRLMHGTLGMGEFKKSVDAAARVEGLYRRFERAVKTARALCGCRSRRGDPNREACDALYRKWLQPEEKLPSA